MSEFLDSALLSEVERRLSLLESGSLQLDQSEVRAIARDAVAPELGTMAMELDSLRALATMQAKELEILRKRVQPDVLPMIMSAVDPLMDGLISLEQRAAPKEAIAAVAESAQAAKNAAASAVKNSEIALLAYARNFVFGS